MEQEKHESDDELIETVEKPKKKPMSEAKEKALLKARETYKKNTEVRKALNKMKIEEEKKELEAKMVEQAIKIKKKHLKKVKIMEDIANDDDDRTRSEPKSEPKSKYIFM